MTTDLPHKILECILAADRQSANEVIDQWAGEHTYKKAVTDILEPALELFGKQWASDENISLAQGYIAAKIAEDVLIKTAEEQPLKLAEAEMKGPVVLGNIEDDYHALGRKMVSVFLQTAGWKVHDLGNDVLAEEFVDKAVEVGAKVIGVSAMMDLTAMNIIKLREEIDRRNLTGQIQLAVGGAVFKLRPELMKKVGGDGTAANAIEAPGLMEKLWAKAESNPASS